MNTRDDACVLTRRNALRGAVAVAGVAWLAPVVTIVTMDSASAASAPPPVRGSKVGAHTVAAVADPGDPGDPGTSANSALAFTGSNTAEIAGAGAATVIVGAAALTVAHKLRRKTEHPEPD